MSALVIVANRLPVKRRSAVGVRGRGLPEGSRKRFTALSRRVAGPGSGGPVAAASPGCPPTSATTCVTVQLDAADLRGYYDGFANATLWPLYHDLIRSPVVPPRLVGRLSSASTDASPTQSPSAAAPRAAVWVHDYHLQLVPALVRERRPDLRIGFFLHIPFPPADLFARLPWRSEVLDGIAGADLIGFQTPRDAGRTSA